MLLFTVEFTDNTIFKQPKDDVSKVDKKRSAFYDVLNSGKEVKTFKIGKVKVDLTDGHFEVGNETIQVGEDLPNLPRKLIFYRQHQHDTVSNYEANDKGIFGLKSVQETGHRIKYFVGFEMNIKGKVEKRLIAI